MSERSWFSIRTTTSWSKLLLASEWIGRGTAESPGATRGTTLHATTARAATRIEAAITRNAGGRPVGGIKGTSERCPHPNPRYMPTRGRISTLVTAMRNTHVRGTNEKSMLRTFAGSTNPTDRLLPLPLLRPPARSRGAAPPGRGRRPNRGRREVHPDRRGLHRLDASRGIDRLPLEHVVAVSDDEGSRIRRPGVLVEAVEGDERGSGRTRRGQRDVHRGEVPTVRAEGSVDGRRRGRGTRRGRRRRAASRGDDGERVGRRAREPARVLDLEANGIGAGRRVRVARGQCRRERRVPDGVVFPVPTDLERAVRRRRSGRIECDRGIHVRRRRVEGEARDRIPGRRGRGGRRRGRWGRRRRRRRWR